MYEIIILSLCPEFQLLNRLTDFHETYYERYAIVSPIYCDVHAVE
jgi:hypothetical protein